MSPSRTTRSLGSRSVRWLTAVAALSLSVPLALTSPAAAAATPLPATPLPSALTNEIETQFRASTTGQATGIRLYRPTAGASQVIRAALWSSSGKLIAKTAFFTTRADVGWQSVSFIEPAAVSANRLYALTYDQKSSDLSTPSSYQLEAVIGSTSPSPMPTATISPSPSPTPTATISPSPSPTPTPTATISPSPSPTPTPTATISPSPTPTASSSPSPTPTASSSPIPGGWPGASNTGVPTGVTLTPYTGPCTITQANTVIDSRAVNCSLSIRASGVIIRNTRVNGSVSVREGDTGSLPIGSYALRISDSEIHIGDNLNTGLMQANYYANRIEITGGRRSAYCANNCLIENSWVHAQGGDPGGDAHFSGIRMSQNGTFRHNTITCEALRGPGTGCSAGLTGYGDFAPVQNNLIENNRFIGGNSTFCAYGGSSPSKPYSNYARNIRFVNNTFVRGASGFCGNLGTIASFSQSAPGNVWSGNYYDDGRIVLP
jgi:hypothetical protein